MRRTLQLLGLAVVIGGVYALGALLPFWFLASPSSGAAFFPPAGITLAALALTPRRTWPLWLVAAGAAELAVDVTHGLPLSLSIGFAIANTAEPLVGASTMRLLSHRYGRSYRGALVCYVLGAVVVGPFVGAAIGDLVSTIWGSGDTSVFLTWWLGDALGVLVVATPIMAWARHAPFEPHGSIPEVAAVTAVSASVILVPGILWQRPMLYLVLPCLIWAALRGGSRAVSTAGFFTAFAADWIVVTGRADQVIGGDFTPEHLVNVQLYLATTLLAALLLCVEIARRVHTEWNLRRSEAERIRAEVALTGAAANERHRIARETHDIVGHALNVMLLQAGAARRFVHGDPARTRELLEQLEETGRDAFSDLDIALGISGGLPLEPDQGLEAVPALVEKMRVAGLRIDLTVEADEGKPLTLVGWSAYRIIQEALTNVAKHAPQSRVSVTIRNDPDAVCLSVISTNGRRAPTVAPGGANSNGQARDGQGLIGMRERVAVLGGDIDVGPMADGFAVRVRLPAQGRPT
jgi:signal transduction histidine kinase